MTEGCPPGARPAFSLALGTIVILSVVAEGVGGVGALAVVSVEDWGVGVAEGAKPSFACASLGVSHWIETPCATCSGSA